MVAAVRAVAQPRLALADGVLDVALLALVEWHRLLPRGMGANRVEADFVVPGSGLK